MQKWEYKVVNNDSIWASEPVLNLLGEQGWEVVGCSFVGGGTISFGVVLKRPKQ